MICTELCKLFHTISQEFKKKNSEVIVSSKSSIQVQGKRMTPEASTCHLEHEKLFGSSKNTLKLMVYTRASVDLAFSLHSQYSPSKKL